MSRSIAALLALVAAGLIVVAAPAGADPAVLAAQRALQARGYDPGPADARLGPKTVRAIAAFQEDHSLPATGELDALTRHALGLTGARAESGDEDHDAAGEVREAQRGPPAAGILSFEELGWHPPQSGVQALERYQARPKRSPIMRRNYGQVSAPDGERIYVLAQGEKIPGFECDPRIGETGVELLFRAGGPVFVKDLGGTGVCQLGFGAVLMVGMTVEVKLTAWRDPRAPAGGKARIGPEGLTFVSP